MTFLKQKLLPGIARTAAAEAVPVPALDCTPPFDPPNFLLKVRMGDIVINVQNAEDVPYKLAQRYAVLSAYVKANYPANVRDFRFEDILTNDNLLVFITKNKTLQAAAYGSRVEDKRGPGLTLHGFCSLGEEKGMGEVMIAALVVAETHWSGVPPHCAAVARKYKNGSLNLASTIPFSRLFFYGAGYYDQKITLADIHLFSEVMEKPDGLYVGCHLMRGKAKDIEPRARVILTDGWDIEYGKTLANGLGSIATKERDDD